MSVRSTLFSEQTSGFRLRTWRWLSGGGCCLSSVGHIAKKQKGWKNDTAFAFDTGHFIVIIQNGQSHQNVGFRGAELNTSQMEISTRLIDIIGDSHSVSSKDWIDVTDWTSFVLTGRWPVVYSEDNNLWFLWWRMTRWFVRHVARANTCRMSRDEVEIVHWPSVDRERDFQQRMCNPTRSSSMNSLSRKNRMKRCLYFILGEQHRCHPIEDHR